MAEAEVLAQMVLCLPVAECLLLCPALAHQQPQGAAVVFPFFFFFAADAHVLRLVAAGVENPCLTPSFSSTEALFLKRTFT